MTEQMISRISPIALVLCAVSVSCTFDVSGPGPAASSERFVIVDDTDRLHAVHGESCSGVVSGGTIRLLADTLRLPTWATEATLFLNGWRLEYESKDHEMAGMGVTLANVDRSNGLLTWEAAAALSDHNFDDSYNWCYNYTALAWNGALIDAAPAYLASQDEIEELEDLFSSVADGNTTALKARFRVLREHPLGPAAVLPMGFGLKWDSGDHHLLQAAYELGQPTRFLEAGRRYVEGQPELTASDANSDAITWVSRPILKDNKGVRDYDVGEVVSVVTGADVGFVVPPYAFLPVEDVGLFGMTGCIGPSPDEQDRDVVIEDVPFEYAFPVLTGWNLIMGCDDEHVREIGIRIDTMSYVQPAASGGTLSYRVRSVLRDRDSAGHGMSHRVAILGFIRTESEAPLIEIHQPAHGTAFGTTTPVPLVASAVDPQEGSLPDSHLRWFSSIDGFLGAGQQLQTLLSGSDECESSVEHEIRVEATDSDGNRSDAHVTVFVARIC